ncbi:MAG: hypothetical protein RIQ56_960 [Candidatus Parcubacteria bacterium]|jgi:hypothetical protein
MVGDLEKTGRSIRVQPADTKDVRKYGNEAGVDPEPDYGDLTLKGIETMHAYAKRVTDALQENFPGSGVSFVSHIHEQTPDGGGRDMYGFTVKGMPSVDRYAPGAVIMVEAPPGQNLIRAMLEIWEDDLSRLTSIAEKLRIED